MNIHSDLVTASGTHLKITEAKTASEVTSLLEDVPQDSTIFVDIDDTIIAPISNSFRIHHSKDFISGIKARPEDYTNPEEIVSNWRLQRKVILIDNDWIAVLDKLKKSYPVYGLTAMDSGRCGKIDSMEQWRSDELQGLGVVFTQNKIIQELKADAGYKVDPVFYDGIFFTGKASKGDTIKLFDEALSVKFIVFIDDRLDHIQNVEEFCKHNDIGFLGIHFTGAKFVSGTYDSELAAFQKQYLIEHGKWLEDDEAIKLK